MAKFNRRPKRLKSNLTKKKLSSRKQGKNEIRKRNPNIFYFKLDSFFIYESRHCNFYYNQLDDKNKMKPHLSDIKFLKEYERNYSIFIDDNSAQRYIEVPKFISDFFKNMKKINPLLDERDKRIKSLIDSNKSENISCRKLSELYKNTYDQYISKTTINKILKYKLELRFLKSV